MPLRPAMLNGDGTVLAPAKLAQTLQKGGGIAALVLRAGRPEISNGGQLCCLPLRVSRERPCGHAADERKEFASPRDKFHFSPSHQPGQHSGLGRIRSGARCNAGSQSSRCRLRVKATVRATLALSLLFPSKRKS